MIKVKTTTFGYGKGERFCNEAMIEIAGDDAWFHWANGAITEHPASAYRDLVEMGMIEVVEEKEKEQDHG